MEKPFEESWFFAPLREPGETALLPKEEAHHLTVVLRVKIGRPIIITNGKGRVFRCNTAQSKEGIVVHAVSFHAVEAESPRMSIALGLLKGRDTEEPVEGLCQLPLAAIHLVTTEHSQVFKGQDHGRLVERLRQKSLTAVKQAKKPWLTEIHAPRPLKQWREDNPGPIVLVHPGPDRILGLGHEKFCLLTGPEGGFSETELKWLAHSGQCFSLGLGPTRIRGTHSPLVACGKAMGLGMI